MGIREEDTRENFELSSHGRMSLGVSQIRPFLSSNLFEIAARESK